MSLFPVPDDFAHGVLEVIPHTCADGSSSEAGVVAGTARGDVDGLPPGSVAVDWRASCVDVTEISLGRPLPPDPPLPNAEFGELEPSGNEVIPKARAANLSGAEGHGLPDVSCTATLQL